MLYDYHYDNMEERKLKVDEAEALGYRMIYDNFDPDWKEGDEPHGTMCFTDEPEPPPPPPALSHSTHYATVVSIDLTVNPPVQAMVYWKGGEERLMGCYVTEWVAEYYIQGHKIDVGDWVMVTFIECMTETPVVHEKVFPSWEL